MVIDVHLPKPLLEAVDRRARALRISRDELIVQAVERELAVARGWSAGFFEELAQTDELTRKTVDEMLGEVRARRT